MTKQDDPEIEVTVTEHPFEGLQNGNERLAKAELARQINKLIKARGLKQADAATQLGITQPEVSNLANGRLSGFTFERLYRCLSALDIGIQITLIDLPEPCHQVPNIVISTQSQQLSGIHNSNNLT